MTAAKSGLTGAALSFVSYMALTTELGVPMLTAALLSFVGTLFLVGALAAMGVFDDF